MIAFGLWRAESSYTYQDLVVPFNVIKLMALFDKFVDDMICGTCAGIATVLSGHPLEYTNLLLTFQLIESENANVGQTNFIHECDHQDLHQRGYQRILQRDGISTLHRSICQRHCLLVL